MDNNLLLVVVIVISLIAGSLMGYFFAKIIIARRNKKLLKDAIKVIEGKKENFVEIDGVKYPAEKFVVKNEKNKKLLINLKGGEIKEYAPKENQKENREIISKDNSPIREDSRGSGTEERNPRTRRRILRRFG